jgi:hypothetical protein
LKNPSLSFCLSGGAVARCDVCFGEIYSGDLAHLIDGFVVCPECFFDFAFDYFADRMVCGGELREMIRTYEDIGDGG